MCGRATLLSSQATLEKRFNARFASKIPLVENVNISAGDLIPVVTSSNPHHIQMFTLGFTPHWAHKQTYMLNARAEGSNNKENKRDKKTKKKSRPWPRQQAPRNSGSSA